MDIQKSIRIDQPGGIAGAVIAVLWVFTPENVYFQSDRVQQVFGLKLNQAG